MTFTATPLADLALEDCDGDGIVAGLLDQGAVGFLVGAPNAGKSALAVLLAHRVASGSPFLGQRCAAAPVMIVAAEARKSMQRRLVARRQRDGAAPVYLWGGPGNLTDADEVAALRAKIRALGAGLLVVDTALAALAGLDLLDLRDAGRAMRILAGIASEGAAVLVLHHSAKAEGSTSPIGSISQQAGADIVLNITAGEDGHRKLWISKARDYDTSWCAGFRIEVETVGHDAVGGAITAAVAVPAAGAPARREKPLPAQQSRVLAVVHDLAAGGTVGVEAVLAEAVARGVTTSESTKTARMVVRRTLATLADLGRLTLREGVITMAQGTCGNMQEPVGNTREHGGNQVSGGGREQGTLGTPSLRTGSHVPAFPPPTAHPEAEPAGAPASGGRIEMEAEAPPPPQPPATAGAEPAAGQVRGRGSRAKRGTADAALTIRDDPNQGVLFH
ncbi:AAA family ATPase [Roseomonas elaeocarpi]|uniref:AAA family ATPase n=1 Tax=Roseomonas elaeocarpi TaxID=907779 RepID=A0ABV6JTB4_9PROT